MSVVFQQIGVIFGYMVVGYAAGRLHLINSTEQKFLSKLITTLILPFTVISSGNAAYSADLSFLSNWKYDKYFCYSNRYGA